MSEWGGNGSFLVESEVADRLIHCFRVQITCHYAAKHRKPKVYVRWFFNRAKAELWRDDTTRWWLLSKERTSAI